MSDLFIATTLDGRTFPASTASADAPLIDDRTGLPVPRADCRGCLLQFATPAEHSALLADCLAEAADMGGKAARLAALLAAQAEVDSTQAAYDASWDVPRTADSAPEVEATWAAYRAAWARLQALLR